MDFMQKLLLDIRDEEIKRLQSLNSLQQKEKNWLNFLLTTDEKYFSLGFCPTSQKQFDFYSSDADITVFGGAAGSGKSFCGINDVLKYVHESTFNAVVFRRTTPQLKGPDGMWDLGNTQYNKVVSEFMPKSKLGVQSQELKITFPSKSTVRFKHLEHVKNKLDIQGWQISEAIVDEATQFELEQVMYIISRLRNPACPVKSHMKLMCNPDADSYLRKWLEKGQFLDKEGYPIYSKSGQVIYCGQIGNDLEFRQTLEEWKADYPDLDPMTFTFIPATCEDNPVLMRLEPQYLTKLKNLPRVERARLLEGNWFVREQAAGYFKREWCGDLLSAYQLPRGKRWVRSWDMAATLPSEVYPDPDYTVGIAGTVDDMGTVYITDVVRGRWRPSGVHEEMKKTAKRDGPDCTITIPVDSGAAGKQAADHTTSMLFSEGYTVRQKRTSNTAKVKRFEPVAALAENGMIKVVKAEWNEIFFDELEQFTGDGKGHDDLVDALSDLVNELVMKKAVGSFSLPDLGGLTQANPFNK